MQLIKLWLAVQMDCVEVNALPALVAKTVPSAANLVDKVLPLELIKSAMLQVLEQALPSKPINSSDAGKLSQADSGPDSYIVDSGSANHMVSPKDLTKADLEDAVETDQPSSCTDCFRATVCTSAGPSKGLWGRISRSIARTSPRM